MLVATRSRSFSDITNPELPPLDFSAIDPNFSPIDHSGYEHSQLHHNSVPSITYQHHDSISSIQSDGSTTSFPYFDSSMPAGYFELENSQNVPNAANSHTRRATDPSHNSINVQHELHSPQYPWNPPNYTPEPISPNYSGQEVMVEASEAIRSQSEGSFGTSVLAESLRLSSAQERRRRARTRFEMASN